MDKQPLVSVCIPSYNHAQYLPYCIESVLAQTYQNIEIIIVDDNSPDNSLEIAQAYAAKYPGKIRVYTHPNNANRGISATVNLAFNLSKGKYWSGLPSDDALCRDKIEKQATFLEANLELGFVYSYGNYMDSDGNKIPGVFGEDITKDADPLATILRGNVIPGMTVLARREAAETVGLHDENLVYSDWDFWIRFFALYKGGFIPESLVEYRIHNYNTSVKIDPLLNYDHILQVSVKLQKSADKILGLEDPKYHKIIAEQLSRLPLRESMAHLDSYFTAIDSNQFLLAASLLKKAIRVSPRTVCKPRRIAAIIKHAALSIVNSAQSNTKIKPNS